MIWYKADIFFLLINSFFKWNFFSTHFFQNALKMLLMRGTKCPLNTVVPHINFNGGKRWAVPLSFVPWTHIYKRRTPTVGKHPLTLRILLFYIRPLSFCETGVQSKKHPRPQSKKEQTFQISLLSRQWGSKPCHTCDFLYWNAFLGPYVLQDWNLTKSFQSISLK